MAVRELTEEELAKMNEEMMKKMDREFKHLSKEELESEIIDYLNKRQVCSLATCGKDGVPRISVVNFANQGITIYIFSEGGKKFQNLKENNKVAIGIGNDYKSLDGLRGINIWGNVSIITEEDQEFDQAMKLFRPTFEMIEKEAGVPITFPKGMLRIIRIAPTKMVFYNNKNGISNAHWEA
jgi:nitroimidazol reductase NimA-like FMN-containing flavoprotein (pyridoxamine 5'-phosphate oxidase superfamily)